MKLAQHMPPMLQWLGIRQVGASDRGMIQLVASLPLHTLHHVDVGGAMDVGDATVEALVQRWPPRLMKLFLGNRVTDSGMNLLQPMVQRGTMVDRDPPGDRVSMHMLQQLASALFARGIRD
ncbi:hypothetical protein GGF32_004593 [Allomyces javanicus]|nr:hypothetical protein GGF32_004593 [Allomyces javanicus]